jgi:hypothetical protein
LNMIISRWKVLKKANFWKHVCIRRTGFKT